MKWGVRSNGGWRGGAARIVAAVAMALLLGAPAGSAPVVSAERAAGPAAFGLPWTPPANSYRIRVDADGLYSLTYTDLSTALLPIDMLDPRSFRLYWMGQEVPIRVLGEEDGRFDSGDVVLFYGRSVDSLFLDGILPTNKYTKDNIYWLTYGCASGPCDGPYGLRMAEIDGSSAGDPPADFAHREHLEKSTWYFSSYPMENDADHWYADWVTPTVPRTYPYYAYNHPAARPDGSLTVKLLGWGGNAHHLRLWVNNNLVLDGSPDWFGFTEYTVTVPVPGSYFLEGLNRIRVGIVLPLGIATDQVYTNWVDVTYSDTFVAENNVLAFNNANLGAWRYEVSNFGSPTIEVFDVTDHAAPRRIVNTTIGETAPHTVSFGVAATGPARYLAVAPAAWRKPVGIDAVTPLASTYTPVDLLDTANRADYILITHRDFWSQSLTIAQYRARDFGVALVDVQHIYDQFNGGMMSAESIRDFLAYAHGNWSKPMPMYVLLMGDGNNDMRKYRTANNTYIPPYLYLADPSLGETAADNRFVAFGTTDTVPDMHLGRLPANTPEQAQAMVDKIVAYETGCTCGSWNYNTLFTSDDLEGGGGDFYAFSNLIADGYVDAPANTIKLVPPSYQVQKEYLGQTCDVVGNPADAVECRNNIVSSLNTKGALFVSFVGHATKEYWAAERIFDKSAVAALDNAPCLPIMLPMTCYEGSYHDYETPETLGEAAVRQPVSGAIASFSPTGFGLVTGHDYLEEGLMLAWFHRGIDRLGAATTFAKQHLVDESPPGKYLDLLDTFVLLGDPGLQVKTGDACLAPTSVVMSAFSAHPGPANRVRVLWESTDESDALGYQVLRREVRQDGTPVAPFEPLNRDLILAKHSGLAAGSVYGYIDRTAEVDPVYQYALRITHLDGRIEQFGQAEIRARGGRPLPKLPDQDQ